MIFLSKNTHFTYKLHKTASSSLYWQEKFIFFQLST